MLTSEVNRAMCPLVATAAAAVRVFPASLADAWLADVVRIQALIDCRQERRGS